MNNECALYTMEGKLMQTKSKRTKKQKYPPLIPSKFEFNKDDIAIYEEVMR